MSTAIKYSRYSIELDCAPGGPRPNELLPSVLEGTGVTLDPEITVARCFGNFGIKSNSSSFEYTGK